MARMKQTPKEPNVDRPVVAVGSDIQSCRKKANPKTYTRQSLEQRRQAAQETSIQKVAALRCPTNQRNQEASPLLGPDL